MANSKGQVFLTREKIAKGHVINMLFLGRPSGKGDYVVEVTCGGGFHYYAGKNAHELIVRVTIRDPRSATFKVKPNDF